MTQQQMAEGAEEEGAYKEGGRNGRRRRRKAEKGWLVTRVRVEADWEMEVWKLG